MTEQESECHFCYFCGADDVSAPFSKSVDGNYVCPECQSKNSILMKDDIMPCFCGAKPYIDRKLLILGCPNRCVSMFGTDFNRLIKQWNEWVSYNKEHKDEVF